jgi:hypothetical protein
MFAPAGRNDGTTGLPVGLHNCLILLYGQNAKEGKFLIINCQFAFE